MDNLFDYMAPIKEFKLERFLEEHRKNIRHTNSGNSRAPIGKDADTKWLMCRASYRPTIEQEREELLIPTLTDVVDV